jgi:hypothetical protein
MKLGILIGGAWNRAASVADFVSGFKAIRMFPLDQNSISNK